MDRQRLALLSSPPRRPPGIRPAAWAGNGHILHGVGAVNSSMGGAGVALPNDTLGALLLNPALLAQMDGHRFEFSAEYNDGRRTPSRAERRHVLAAAPRKRATRPSIPAFGWTHHKRGRLAFGMGFLGLAGFGVDYPQDPTNPLLAPQPHGFGRVYSNYQL